MNTRNILVFAVLALIASTTYAVSSGRLPFAACTVDLPWGCPNDKFINGDRLNCSVAAQRGNLMPWATEPLPTADITVTAEIEGNPVTKYISGGELLDIKIRVSKISLYWRGLLIYALNSLGQKVGTWRITAGAPYLTDRNMCGNNTLLHSRANEKPTTEIFRFVTPAVGTGTITFQTLVKSGPANTGAFWLPAPLTLTEFGPEPPFNGTLRWLRAAVNRTCTATCAAVRVNNTAMQCDDRYFSFFNTANDLGTNLRNHGFVCNHPRTLTCTNVGPAANPSTDTCIYTSPTQCSSLGKPVQAVTCNALTPTLQRYCPCNTASGLAGPLETPTLFVPPSDAVIPPPPTEISPASALQASKLWIVALSAIVGLLGNRKQQFFVALLLAFAFAAPVQAHNWLNMPSRSAGYAEQIFPCPPRQQLAPHVQVNAGNEFQVEWVTGHDRFTYWTLVRAGDESKLATLSEAMMDDYLNSANASADGINGARGVILNPKYNKFHRVARNSTDNRVANFYQRVVPVTDPLFVPRPTRDIGGFLSPTGFSNGSAYFQVEFRASNRTQDRRAEYFNPKYPFVISMAKFEHVTDQATQPDFTLLRIPANAPKGSYIAWWRWSGYYDCVDVEVLDPAPQVDHLFTYGVVPFNANSSFLKIDHATVKPFWIKSLGDFTRNNTYGCTLIRPGFETADFNKCKSFCNRNNIGNNRFSSCAGVVVAPLSLPAVSPFGIDDIEIPWDFVSRLDNQKRNQCPRDVIANAPSGSRLCYPIAPFGVTEAPTAAPMLTSTKDAENPIFYSSFYIRTTERVFTQDPVDFVRPLPAFNFGTQCGVCAERVFGNQDNNLSPIWRLADICRDCDDPFWGGI